MNTPDAVRSLEQRVHELTVLNELIGTLASTLELHEILHIVLDRIKTLAQAEALSLLLYDAQRDELVFAATETLRENALVGIHVPRGRGVASWVASTGSSAMVADAAADPRFYAEVDHLAHFATRALLAVPVLRDDRVLGAIEIANRYGGEPYTEMELRALERVAHEASGLVDPAAPVHDPEATRQVLAHAAAVGPSEAASLLLYDAGGRELIFRASRTLQSGVIDGLRMGCGQGIAGWVARHRETVRLDDAATDPRYYAGIESQTHFTPRSMLCVPMVSRDTLRGVIQVINKVDGSIFGDEEQRMVETLAKHAAVAIENASLYHQAQVASITDDLTGLANTRHFNRTLPELIAHGGPVSLVVLDLDNFKEVVDTHGHLVGSRTIAQVGRLIGRLLRPGAIAARFGGDEFVVVLPGTPAPQAQQVAEGIRAAVESCAELEEDGIDIAAVTASVGVATFPDHAATAEALFRAADAAMYSVKNRKKNGVAMAPPQRAPTSPA